MWHILPVLIAAAVVARSVRSATALGPMAAHMSAARSEGDRIAVVVSSDCPRADRRTHREVGAGFSASMAQLMHIKEVFPKWRSVLATSKRWSAGCDDAFNELNDVYWDRFGEAIEVLFFRLDGFLGRIHNLGKETRVESYIPLVLPEILGRKGYDYAVVMDPDVFFLDDTLTKEISKVNGVGCIASIPPDCLTNPKNPASLHDEYHLIADPALLSEVKRTAEDFNSHYIVRNTTNSGLVIYNTKTLAALNWTRWVTSLFDVGGGFDGAQTALSAALGRTDLPIHWLPPRFNVPLTLPKSYIRSTCGPDARYSWSLLSNDTTISSVHFIWGPKPWTSLMATPHLDEKKFGLQADLPFANDYRAVLRRLLPNPDTRANFFAPGALDTIPNISAHRNSVVYAACDLRPHPCVPDTR